MVARGPSLRRWRRNIIILVVLPRYFISKISEIGKLGENPDDYEGDSEMSVLLYNGSL